MATKDHYIAHNRTLYRKPNKPNPTKITLKGENMGLSNTAQAIAVFISTFCLALGTAGAALPDFIPPEYKASFAVVFWFLGILGFALKEALGGQAPTPTT
jgi:hypothetical protein